MERTPHVVVIGGGIAGLATAYFLLKRAREQDCRVRCTILEASERFGGKLISERADGFLFEGGPDSLLAQKPWALDLCKEIGLEDRLIPSQDRRRSTYMVRDGRLYRFPTGYRLVIPKSTMSILRTSLLSPAARIRAAMEPWIPPRKEPEDESIAAFFGRRFGPDFASRFAGPLLAGIFVGDAARLSVASLFPQFPKMERTHGSLMRGAKHLASNQRDTTGTPLFTSLRGGMAEMIQPLVDALAGERQTGSPVAELRRRSDGFHVHTAVEGRLAIRADLVVLAVPSFAAANMVRGLDSRLSDCLDAIPHVSSATVSLGYDRTDLAGTRGLDGFGLLVPPGEESDLLGCTVLSNKFTDRADDSKVLLRAFVGGRENEHLLDLDDADLISRVRSDLKKLTGLGAEPSVSRVYRWPKGNPQYEIGHADRIATIRRLASPFPGLYLTGSSYDGFSVSDVVRTAKERSVEMTEFVRTLSGR